MEIVVKGRGKGKDERLHQQSLQISKATKIAKKIEVAKNFDIARTIEWNKIMSITEAIGIGVVPLDKCNEIKRSAEIIQTLYIAEEIKFELRDIGSDGDLTKIYFDCSFGHIQVIAPGYLTRDVKCSQCDNTKKGIALREMDELAEENDWILLTRIYKNYNIQMHFFCEPCGYVRMCSRGSFENSPSFCPECSDTPHNQNKVLVRKIVEDQGGTMEGIFMTMCDKIRCVCVFGHVCFPTGDGLKRGYAVCRRCSGTCPIYAEERFFEIMQIFKCDVRSTYYGTKKAIHIICSVGHHCYLTPGDVLRKKAMICVECNGTTPEVSEERFNKYVSDANFTPIPGSKYNGSKNKVKCECPVGHEVELVPGKVHQCGVKCQRCDGHMSFLEMITMKALDSLGIVYKTQVIDPNMMLLKFDFMFISNKKTYYVEVDGKQHQEFNAYFHGNKEGFEFSRQRDLVKNHLVRTSENLRLIRLAHPMFSNRNPDNHDILVENIKEYIKNAIKSGKKIVADPTIYKKWVNAEPDEEYIYKYKKNKSMINI